MNKIPPRYLIYFIPETSRYAMYDTHDPLPMRKIFEEDIICYCNSYEKADMVYEALTEMDLI